MNSNDLFDVIGEASERHVLDALNTRGGAQLKMKRLSLNRVLLIAAAIALLLVLAGCVAVFLGLQSRVIGEVSYTKYADDQGEPIAPTEIVQNVISLYGYQGSSSYKAAQEWYSFLENYDPGDEAFSNENTLNIPDNYYFTYQCVTWDMVDMVDEIARKYNLKTMGTLAVAQNWDTELFFEAIGIDGLCRSGAQANVKYGSGYFYPEGAFRMSADIALIGEEALWTDWVYTSVLYTRKDLFDPKFTTINPSEYEEWTYSTPDGTEVLIAMGPNDALLFAEQEDAYITVTMATNIPALDLRPEEDHTTKEALQQLADVYDFTIRPKPVEDMESVRAALEESNAAWEAERMAAASIPGHGSFSEYLINEYDRIRSDLYYCFLDINHDGAQDLILGSKDGKILQALTITDEVVSEMDYNLCGYLYEDDVLMQPDYWDHTKTFRFYQLNGSSVEFLFYLDYDQRTDRWCRNSTDWDRELASPITEQDAQKIINGYSRINMKMVPLMEFIVDTDGTTLRQAIEAGALHVSEVEMLRIYADYIKEYNATGYDRSCKYYCLKDVNNDAITDLIFSDNTDEFHHIVTVYNGELRLIVSQDHLFLCEDGILLSNFRQFNGDGTQTTTYNWYKLDCTMPNGGRVLISSVKYNPQEPAWYFDEDANGYYEKIISQSEYDAVIDSYPRIELDMKPIAEFPGQ